MSRGTLYELTGIHASLMELLYDEDVDQSELITMIEEMEGEIEQKADGYAKIIRNIESDANAIEKELDRLGQRKAVLENRKKFLKQSLEGAMRFVGKTKFKTELFSFNIQKNAPSAFVPDEKEFLEWAESNRKEFVRYKDPEVNKSELLVALKDGEVIPGAELKQTESLRIR